MTTDSDEFDGPYLDLHHLGAKMSRYDERRTGEQVEQTQSGGRGVEELAQIEDVEERSRLVLGDEDELEAWKAFEGAQIYPCPPDACLGANRCLEGHTGPVCGICLPG